MTLFHQRPPRRDLRAVVAALWQYSDATPQAPRSLIIPPDGCADLIWDGTALRLAPPTTEAFAVDGAGTATGLRLRPGALAALTVGSQRPWAEVVEERLAPHLSLPALAETPAASLQQLIDQVLAERPPAESALALSRALGRPWRSVDDLADSLGMAPRSLRRHLGAATGAGPKRLLRILRLQRLLRVRARYPGASLARLADALGYADQAHMTRETVALIGLPPSQLTWRPDWPFCSRQGQAEAAG